MGTCGDDELEVLVEMEAEGEAKTEAEVEELSSPGRTTLSMLASVCLAMLFTIFCSSFVSGASTTMDT